MTDNSIDIDYLLTGEKTPAQIQQIDKFTPLLHPQADATALMYSINSSEPTNQAQPQLQTKPADPLATLINDTPLAKPGATVVGAVYNKATKELINATIQLIQLSDNKPLSDPYQLTNGTYTAWTDQDPATVGVKFSLEGFQPVIASISDLQANADVFLSAGSDIPVWAIAVVLLAVYTMRKKGKVGKFSTGDLMPIFMLAGGIIGFSVIIKILKTLGLWGGGTTAAEQSDPKSSFKPDYWTQFTHFTYAIDENTAASMGKTIHDAFGVFQDDFNAVMGVFKLLRTKANVSFLAWEFQKQYDEDLLTFLTNGGGILPWDGLSTDHMNQIIDYVHGLPTN